MLETKKKFLLKTRLVSAGGKTWDSFNLKNIIPREGLPLILRRSPPGHVKENFTDEIVFLGEYPRERRDQTKFQDIDYRPARDLTFRLIHSEVDGRLK